MSFLRQSVSTFATQVATMVFGMATGIITARVLGPEVKGQAALLSNATQLLFMVGSMGLGSAFAFFIGQERYPARQIMSMALVFSLLFGLVANALFYLSLPLHQGMWRDIPFLLLVLSTGLAIAQIYSTHLIRITVGHGRIYAMNSSSIAYSVTSFISVILFVALLQQGLAGVVNSLWVATLFQIVLLAWLLRDNLLPTLRWQEGIISATFSYGVKSHTLLIINYLNYRLDIFLLQYLTGDSIEVGFYSLAVGMAEMMWLVPNAVVAPLFSTVVRDHQNGYQVTLQVCRWSLLFLLILAVAGICFGHLFIGLLYGKAFLPSFAPFLLLLPGVCLFPLFKLLIVDLSARGYPGYGTVTSAVALVVNVVGNFLLIPQFGGVGAAMATSISYAVMSVISLVLFCRVAGTRFSEIFFFRKSEIQIIKINLMRILGKSG